MKRFLLLPVFIFTICTAFAQGAGQRAGYTVTKYESITTDPFKTVPEGKLILDYYCTSGFAANDRYWYEIVVIENKLTLSFHAFDGKSFRKTDYLREYRLTDAVVRHLAKVLSNAKLKQLVNGIPVPETAAATKEVLIARHQDQRIGGGRYNHTLFPPGTKQADIDKSIAAERSTNASIGGDFDAVVNALKQQFPALDSLIRAAKK
jgi:hypothetical protein